jgi:hypothetical protein
MRKTDQTFELQMVPVTAGGVPSGFDTGGSDRHLQQLGSSDVVFLIPTWDRIGFHKQRLEWYTQLDCHVSQMIS